MKKYIIIIVAIFVLIGVTIAIASNIKVEKETKYFMYVKNNNLILWNQTNNQKYVLNSNFDTKSKIMLEIYSRYSADKSKIIYADNIDSNYVDLKYVDVNNINEESSKIIAEDVLVYEVTEKGIVYIKDMDLYYYDYNITNEVASDITSYAITKDKRNLYYHLETGEVYKVNLDNLEQTIVASNMDGVGTYGDMVLSYQKKDALFDLYNGDELISDKVINQIDGEGDTLYFTRYEGDLEEFKTSEDILDLNCNIATYLYQNGEVTKIGDGILNLSNGFTDIKEDEYLALGKYNGKTFDISFYNQNTKEVFSLGDTDKYNIYGYDDTTKTVYYQGSDDLFYQAKLIDESLTDPKLIGEDIALFIKINDNVYYIENKTSNLYLVQDDKNTLIAEDVKDWFNLDNNLYYLKNKDDKLAIDCYQCNMKEITNIDSYTTIGNQIFYFTDTSLQDDVLYGNLYTVINGVNVLVDDDVIVSYGVIHLNY